MEHIESLFKKIEYIIGYTLPKEFKNFYLDLKEKNVEIMDLKDIYNNMIATINDNEDYKDLYKIEPANSILAKPFDKKRVPFIKDDAGNFIGIDFNPGEEGDIGQIINYGCDEYYMKVFAYNFKDFIDGIIACNISKDTYITDYLLNHNIDFIREKKVDTSIKKLSNNSFKKNEVKESNISEIVKDNNFEVSNLKKIIDIFSELNNEIMNDNNVKKFEHRWIYYRIINKRDSLSRTMTDEKSFYKKLDNYNKEEIKGFSFSISNYIEELKSQNIFAGEEKIFVEINIISKKILIRYTETIGNLSMKKAYNKIQSII